MLFVDNQNSTDPRVNLAIEEYLLRHVQVDEPLLLFYINAPSVIIGRNQNTLAEIDPDFVEANGVHVVRRLSGGGAVYHDLGNLNFSLVTNGRSQLHNFAEFTQPVIEVLQSLGVDAELRGRSDIFADGKKISGNAQYASGERMFSHGTLLFDSNLENLLKALNPRQVKIESNAVQSIRNFVTNIRELLAKDKDIFQFREALLEGLFGAERPFYDLAPSAWETIAQISQERYQSWDWNYGRSPTFNVQKTEKLPAGKIDVRIVVENGRIQNIYFFGDFSGTKDVAELEKQLVGVLYEKDALLGFLRDTAVSDYFGSIDVSDLVNLIY